MRLAQLLLMAKGGGPPKPDGMEYEWKFSGLKWKEMKKHYSIIPIYIMTIFSLGMAGAYVYRLASQHPEVSWSRRNPEPYNEYRAKQYKFVSSGRDYSKPSPAPTYK